jgi:hypothetical protein
VYKNYSQHFFWKYYFGSNKMLFVSLSDGARFAEVHVLTKLVSFILVCFLTSVVLNTWLIILSAPISLNFYLHITLFCVRWDVAQVLKASVLVFLPLQATGFVFVADISMLKLFAIILRLCTQYRNSSSLLVKRVGLCACFRVSRALLFLV